MGLILGLIVGILAGWLAGKLYRGKGFGIIGNIIVGLLGGLIGGLIAEGLGLTAKNWIGQLVISTTGALVLLIVLNAIFGGRRQRKR